MRQSSRTHFSHQIDDYLRTTIYFKREQTVTRGIYQNAQALKKNKTFKRAAKLLAKAVNGSLSKLTFGQIKTYSILLPMNIRKIDLLQAKANLLACQVHVLEDLKMQDPRVYFEEKERQMKRKSQRQQNNQSTRINDCFLVYNSGGDLKMEGSKSNIAREKANIDTIQEEQQQQSQAKVSLSALSPAISHKRTLHSQDYLMISSVSKSLQSSQSFQKRINQQQKSADDQGEAKR